MKREGADQVTLKIPRPLYEQLKQVIADSGFHSVTEFAVYVLRDLVSHHGRGGGDPLIPPGAAEIPTGAAGSVTGAAGSAAGASESEVQALSPDEIEAIRKRLESLGYL